MNEVIKKFILFLIVVFSFTPVNAWSLADTKENRIREADRYFTKYPIQLGLQQNINLMANVLPISLKEKFKDLMKDNVDISKIEESMKEGMVKHFTVEEIKAINDNDTSLIDESLKKNFDAYLMEVSPVLNMAFKDAFVKISPLIVKEIMNDESLKTRVNNLYYAIAKNDYKIQYEMQIPAIRGNRTFEAWKKDWGLDNPKEELTTKITEGRLEQVCYCLPWQYHDGMQTLRCSLLVSFETKDSEGHPKSYRVLEMWESLNGEWYHGYTDHHEMDNCPKNDFY
jgi:hypothetical protein